MNNDNYPDRLTIKGEGRKPLPDWYGADAYNRLDRLSLFFAGETGPGMLVLLFVAALLIAAFVWGMNVGYDIANGALETAAQEVLK